METFILISTHIKCIIDKLLQKKTNQMYWSIIFHKTRFPQLPLRIEEMTYKYFRQTFHSWMHEIFSIFYIQSIFIYGEVRIDWEGKQPMNFRQLQLLTQGWTLHTNASVSGIEEQLLHKHNIKWYLLGHTYMNDKV